MFKLFKLILILIVIAIIAAFAYLNIFFKSDAEKFASEMTGTKVAMTYVSVSPLDGNISVGGLDIGNPKGFKTKNAIEFDSISAEIVTDSLLEDTVRIKQVNIARPVIYYEVGVNGDNLRTLIKNLQRGGGNSSSSGEEKNVLIENLYLNNGRVIMVGDMFGFKAGEEVAIDNIHLTNLGSKNTSGRKVTEQVLQKILKEAINSKANKLIENPGKVLDGIKDLF